MLSPIDKLKSGANDIIQIIITTSCNLSCSNCTQLLPFRKDYLHMSIECFREAVRSLKEWPGVVALFGGNPCSHPQFPELCRVLAEEIPEQSRRGLWSNDLLRHGQVAYDTFFPNGRFNLNAHGISAAAMRIKESLTGRLIPDSDINHSMHAPILANWKDLGLTEEEWIAKREACDINQKWSGAIVERDGRPYAYFCEVAAALDGIRGVNSGTPATPLWWKMDMESRDFQNQVRTCCDKGCGVPLKLRPRQDSYETYDITNKWGLDTQGAKRPTAIADIEGVYHTHEVTDYMAVRRPR